MAIKFLDPEVDLKALLAEPELVRQKVTHECSGCNTRLNKNGYCPNPACRFDPPVETYECDACGHCSTPNQCVSSIVCPRCIAGVSELCWDDRGGLTGYHEERWSKVRDQYGTDYRIKAGNGNPTEGSCSDF